jgi:TonB family protein
LEASYSDVVLERVRSNWELPKWLKDQGLSANVIIYIDGRGQLVNFRFTKPSGNSQFDDEVKHTLQASAPFSLPPEGIASDLMHEGIALAFPL